MGDNILTMITLLHEFLIERDELNKEKVYISNGMLKYTCTIQLNCSSSFMN